MTDIIERLRDGCVGYPHASISWPHRMLHDAMDEIQALRLAIARIEQIYAADGVPHRPEVANELEEIFDMVRK